MVVVGCWSVVFHGTTRLSWALVVSVGCVVCPCKDSPAFRPTIRRFCGEGC